MGKAYITPCAYHCVEKKKGILILDLDKTLLRGIPFLTYVRKRIESKPMGRLTLRLSRIAWRLGTRTKSDTLRKMALWAIRRFFIREPVPLHPEMFNRDVLSVVSHLARRGWDIRVVSSAPPEAYITALWVLRSAGNIELVHAPGIDDKRRELVRALQEHRNVIVLDDELLGGEKILTKKVSMLKELIAKGELEERPLKRLGVHASSVLERLEGMRRLRVHRSKP